MPRAPKGFIREITGGFAETPTSHFHVDMKGVHVYGIRIYIYIYTYVYGCLCTSKSDMTPGNCYYAHFHVHIRLSTRKTGMLFLGCDGGLNTGRRRATTGMR